MLKFSFYSSSLQEDDFWTSQWPGTVYQRIWTRAWCQKIKRFAFLFMSIYVNIWRTVLFLTAVKISKTLDSCQICFEPNRGEDCPVLRQNPSLAQFPIQILLFWSSWTSGSMSSLWEVELLMEPGRDESCEQLRGDDQAFKDWVLRWKRTSALRMLPTQFGICC